MAPPKDLLQLQQPLCWLMTADIQLAASVDLFVVDVTEVDPPPGVERLHWRLLTTHDVTTVDEAKEIVRWYRRGGPLISTRHATLQNLKGRAGSTCTEAFWVEHQSRPNPRADSASDSWSTRSRHSSMASRCSASALSARLAGRLSRHSWISVEAVRERVDRMAHRPRFTASIFGAAIADHDWWLVWRVVRRLDLAFLAKASHALGRG